MKSETQTNIEKSVNIYRNEVMTHLKYIKEIVNENQRHLEAINGRVRKNENNITAIKTVGSTITIVIGVILTWFGAYK